MNNMTHMLNRAATSQNQPVFEVWWLSWLLRVDTNQRKQFPHCLKQEIEIELHIAADDDCVGQAGQPVDFFDGHLIDLVVHIQTREIHAIGADHVDQFISSAIFSEEDLENNKECMNMNKLDNTRWKSAYLGVEDFVFMQDQLNQLLVDLCQGASGVERQTASFLRLQSKL